MVDRSSGLFEVSEVVAILPIQLSCLCGLVLHQPQKAAAVSTPRPPYPRLLDPKSQTVILSASLDFLWEVDFKCKHQEASLKGADFSLQCLLYLPVQPWTATAAVIRQGGNGWAGLHPTPTSHYLSRVCSQTCHSPVDSTIVFKTPRFLACSTPHPLSSFYLLQFWG